MKKNIVIALILLLSLTMLGGCGDSGPDLTEVKKKYNEAADVFNEAGKVFEANGWANDEESLKNHNDLAAAIEEIRMVIEDPKLSKEIDPELMGKDLDEFIAVLKEYKEAISIPFPSAEISANEVAEEEYANDEQKKEMVQMLVEMFNGVNTDFNLMVEYLDEKKLIEEGSKLKKELQEYALVLQEVHDGLTGDTISGAQAEDFLNKIEATDNFIVQTIDTYLK